MRLLPHHVRRWASVSWRTTAVPARLMECTGTPATLNEELVEFIQGDLFQMRRIAPKSSWSVSPLTGSTRGSSENGLGRVC